MISSLGGLEDPNTRWCTVYARWHTVGVLELMTGFRKEFLDPTLFSHTRVLGPRRVRGVGLPSSTGAGGVRNQEGKSGGV
jgi:hypothetical protein